MVSSDEDTEDTVGRVLPVGILAVVGRRDGRRVVILQEGLHPATVAYLVQLLDRWGGGRGVRA